MKSSKDVAQVHIYLPRKLYANFQALATRKRMSCTHFIKCLIMRALREEKNEKNEQN